MAKLPAVSSPIPPDLRRFLDRTREAVESLEGRISGQSSGPVTINLSPITYAAEAAVLPAVSGLSVEQPFVGRSCRIQWDDYLVASGCTYTVQVYAGSAIKRTVPLLPAPRYEYTFEDAIADGGPFRSLEFRVTAVAPSGRWSKPAVLAAANPQMAAPTGIGTVPAGGSIAVSAALPADSDYAGTKIWVSTSSGFDPAVTPPAYNGTSPSYAALGLTGGQTYYFRIAHYDVFGTDALNSSGEFSVVALHEGGVRKVTALPANPAAVNGETAVFLDVAEATNQRGLWGWDGAAWQYTRSGASLVANSVTADRMNVANLAAISANMGTITAGNLTLDASGFIRGGMTGFSNGTGFWFGYSSGAYKLSLGQSGGSQIVWDGSALNIYGSIGQLLLSSGGVQWGGVTGSGKPADNATVGATFGTNISGQITAANASTYIANLAVDTLQIANNAVTVPSSAYTSGSVISSTINSSTTTVSLTGQTIAVTTSGGKAAIIGSMGVSIPYDIYIGAELDMTVWVKRDGAALIEQTVFHHQWNGGSYGTELFVAPISFSDQPAAGSYTYTIGVTMTFSIAYSSSNASCSLQRRSLIVLEAKK